MEKSYPYKVKANGKYYKPGEPVPVAADAEKTEKVAKASTKAETPVATAAKTQTRRRTTTKK